MVRYISFLLFIGLVFTQDITIAVLDFDGDGVSKSETRTLTNRLRDEMFKTGAYIDEGSLIESRKDGLWTYWNDTILTKCQCM